MLAVRSSKQATVVEACAEASTLSQKVECADDVVGLAAVEGYLQVLTVVRTVDDVLDDESLPPEK